MIKKRLLGVLSILMFAVLGISAQNGDWDFFFGKCPNYLYYVLYYLSPNQGAYEEVIRNDGNTEEIDGKTYNIVRLAYFSEYPSPVTPPQKELILHMRRDGQRLMIRYDEYKAVMEDRGDDMSVFDEQCRYEVSDDGDMVLYDFGMQVGDKFRSIPGKEDITVVSRKTEYAEWYSHWQGAIDVITLSNGCEILENIGFRGQKPYSYWDPRTEPGYDFFDYLNPSDKYGSILYFAKLNYQYAWEDCFDGGQTGIEKVTLTTDSQAIFDLQGRRLDSQPTNKGIYIQNGKKVVVK